MQKCFSRYSGRNAELIAYPMGGLGAGMLCIEGNGAFSNVSLRHAPDLNNEPILFAALHVEGDSPGARVLEGAIPEWKIFGKRAGGGDRTSGNGLAHTSYGLPRFEHANFSSRFPFADIDLSHPGCSVTAKITGWSPFIPGNPDDSGLPVAAVDYTLTNRTGAPIKGVFSFHAQNFMAQGDEARVDATKRGFVLRQPPVTDKPAAEGAFCVEVAGAAPNVYTAWFRGGWFDSLSMLWHTVQRGEAPSAGPPQGRPSPGGSVFVPFSILPHEATSVRILMSWYVPHSTRRYGTCTDGCDCRTFEPWYAARFSSISDVAMYWMENHQRLHSETENFTKCLQAATLDWAVRQAVDANLCILKSPTFLRQHDGRLWGFEGCCTDAGCCHGTCTHVYNYVHAIAQLFPSLERGLRETEFNENQDTDGFQAFRGNLPVSRVGRVYRSAADGQLGGIIKLYRDWRICGDTEWVRSLWPRAKQSMEYCIGEWDPERVGVLHRPHHNTYDIEFWGPNGFAQSFYLSALTAIVEIAEALGEDAGDWPRLRDKACAFFDEELFNGEYYIQKIDRTGAVEGEHSPEERALLEAEGPKYQYGDGCLSDGVLGLWMAHMAGLRPKVLSSHVASHLMAVYRHNFRRDLFDHSNPQRPGYALGHEGGLLLCSWPNGNEPSLPFVYSNEVWTGIEYQVAGHLIAMEGCDKKMKDAGLEIVEEVRSRYQGNRRNPFCEYECGHWYVRALSSYSLIQACGCVRYDAVDRTLYVSPSREDYAMFISWDGGFGLAGRRNGEPFIDPWHGTIDAARMTAG